MTPGPLPRCTARSSPVSAVTCATANAAGAAEFTEIIWRQLLVQLSNFADTEKQFRALLYTVALRSLTDVGVTAEPGCGERWVLPPGSVDRAVALLGNSLPPEQASVVLLRVVADLDEEDTALVLRSTMGAVRLAQYRALVSLVYQFSNRRQVPPSDETMALFLDVTDPTPNLVFRGALPVWQARGTLAPVARLVATARRSATTEETVISPGLLSAVDAMAAMANAPTLERRAKWTWAPGDRRSRPGALAADSDATTGDDGGVGAPGTPLTAGLRGGPTA